MALWKFGQPFNKQDTICPLSTCVPSFNLLGLTVPEKSEMKNFNVWKLERKKNEEINGMNKQQQPGSCIHNTASHCLRVHQVSCQPSCPHNPEKRVTKICNVWKLEGKKNEEINGLISTSSQILVHTIHPPIVHLYTKFQPSRPHSSWEKYDKNL